MNSHTQYAKDWYIELSIFLSLFPYLLTLLITYCNLQSISLPISLENIFPTFMHSNVANNNISFIVNLSKQNVDIKSGDDNCFKFAKTLAHVKGLREGSMFSYPAVQSPSPGRS